MKSWKKKSFAFKRERSWRNNTREMPTLSIFWKLTDKNLVMWTFSTSVYTTMLIHLFGIESNVFTYCSFFLLFNKMSNPNLSIFSDHDNLGLLSVSSSQLSQYKTLHIHSICAINKKAISQSLYSFFSTKASKQ